MTTRLLPDVEAICITYLADHSAVAAIVDGRVYPQPFDKVVKPFLTVRRIGGAAAHPHWTDTAQVEIAAWSYDHAGTSGYDEARELCETAVAALHDIDPIDEEHGAVVTNVSDAGGPRSIPDPVTGNARFIAEVFVTAHPYDNAS